VFLLSLAVVDDLGAIIVVAVLFTASFDLVAACVAVLALVRYVWLQHRRVRTPWVYVPLALITWVALGLMTRVRPDGGEEQAPAIRLEHRLQPWSAAVAVPVFALFAAGMKVSGNSLSTVFTTALPLVVMIGLVCGKVGKVIAILGPGILAVTLEVAERPRDMAGVISVGCRCSTGWDSR
jgi:NhaA family Na+:H+ antiporter